MTRPSKTATEVDISAAERLRQQGREEGFVEGEAKGQARGRAAILLTQLALKFGAPSASTRQRVAAATIAELDAFAVRVLSAQTVHEVFDPAPNNNSARRVHSSYSRPCRRSG